MTKERFTNGTIPSSFKSKGKNLIGFIQSGWIKITRYEKIALSRKNISQCITVEFLQSFIGWLWIMKQTLKTLLLIYPIIWKHYSNPGFMLSKEEQYHHPRWIEKSKKIMLRDGCSCLHCGKTNTHLQVFPLYEDENKYLWELDDDGIKTVCDDCLNLLKKDHNHSKISGIIGFLFSSGKLDISTLNF